MKRLNSNWALFAVNLLVISAPSLSWAAGPACQQVLRELVVSQAGSELQTSETRVDWNNDKSFLEAIQRKESMGLVQSLYSERFQTLIHFTATGLPDAKGQARMIDPDSKGIVLFIHGSGTMKSGGRNFVPNMNTVAKLGYTGISIDLPFHGKGPRDEAFKNPDHFMNWMRNIVRELEKAGKPIIMVGHSFGPDAILEFDTRYPKVLAGYAAISPAGFTKELDKWYQNYTSKMSFGGDVAENEAGGLWAGAVSEKFLWHKSKLADPTIINPNKRARILSGNREEYVPAPLGGPGNTPIGENTYDVSVPLRKMFKNAVITIEPGIGHYLFDHVDANGYNVVTREIMLALGENPADFKKIAEETRSRDSNHTAAEALKIRYVQDPHFKAWAALRFGENNVFKLANRQNDALAKKITDEYIIALKMREEAIYLKILSLKETEPEFYSKYKELFDKANPKRPDSALFIPYLTMVLNKAK